ncbi:acyltransferase [Shewanella sp. 1_MG-2023]|uniref:Acyltransferase n=1 Tax=Shewanella electrodiphila TaxID=934143 RepID=A0ABT0KTE2_9GAMM|nr:MULTISPECIES: acyltransferase [Shewanella]MCC4834675.1 acyltransferase [Shewanella sp. 10N.7]MCL1046929.1 acyltransferase [Shewanella electrodiphila]MDO6613584.1 acyltransferase [Shewanella sp. 7_MG-2023]MDO6773599.1 acyltransferase [Shewanella sp. 2_MG-2023]MDO6796142.1 acyltransferase [Shewanella sp. 1_MG-2023]
MPLFAKIKGSVAFICYVINTIFWVTPILIFSIFKVLPIIFIRKVCSYILDNCASAWISVNGIIEAIFHPTKIKLTGDNQFSEKEWYMVIANHQSWVDILILQRVFNRKIPFLKFFLKQQLIYVPILGLAWWALDFPFMRRYSTAQLKRNPKLKGKDTEITRKSCEKFKHKPVSVMNFVEGTRFHPGKHKKQSSPFEHLLKPKAGGMAFALDAMGSQINKLVNVTIYYPGKIPSYWEYICNDLDEVHVDIQVTDIPDAMRGDYSKDREFKIEFQNQLNQLWLEKDNKISSMAENNK